MAPTTEKSSRQGEEALESNEVTELAGIAKIGLGRSGPRSDTLAAICILYMC